MRKNICFILYGLNHEIKFIKNDRYYITLIKTNSKVHLTHCMRYHTIYCDATFTQSVSGKEMIENIFKPMASLSGGNGFILF